MSRQVSVSWPTPNECRVSAVESETHEGKIRGDRTIDVPGGLLWLLTEFSSRYPAGTHVSIRLEATVPPEPGEVAHAMQMMTGGSDGRD